MKLIPKTTIFINKKHELKISSIPFISTSIETTPETETKTPTENKSFMGKRTD